MAVNVHCCPADPVTGSGRRRRHVEPSRCTTASRGVVTVTCGALASTPADGCHRCRAIGRQRRPSLTVGVGRALSDCESCPADGRTLTVTSLQRCAGRCHDRGQTDRRFRHRRAQRLDWPRAALSPTAAAPTVILHDVAVVVDVVPSRPLPVPDESSTTDAARRGAYICDTGRVTCDERRCGDSRSLSARRSGSMRPRLVVKWTVVPFWTAVPLDSTTNAVISVVPPVGDERARGGDRERRT